MANEHRKTTSLPGRIWNWFKNQFVQDVPGESALCEFDCRNGHCSLDEWETCSRRLDRAAGELMPDCDSSIKKCEKCDQDGKQVSTNSLSRGINRAD
jgi:hypothetical protein